MPKIQFDVLLPAGPAQGLERAFRQALDILVERKKLDHGDVEHIPDVPIDPEVVEQLRENHRQEHEDEELVDASVHRYLISASAPNLSFNQLTMSLSRILTPKAELPKDPVALERETEFEIPAHYPWTVEILR